MQLDPIFRQGLLIVPLHSNHNVITELTQLLDFPRQKSTGSLVVGPQDLAAEIPNHLPAFSLHSTPEFYNADPSKSTRIFHTVPENLETAFSELSEASILFCVQLTKEQLEFALKARDIFTCIVVVLVSDTESLLNISDSHPSPLPASTELSFPRHIARALKTRKSVAEHITFFPCFIRFEVKYHQFLSRGLRHPSLGLKTIPSWCVLLTKPMNLDSTQSHSVFIDSHEFQFTFDTPNTPLTVQRQEYQLMERFQEKFFSSALRPCNNVEKIELSVKRSRFHMLLPLSVPFAVSEYSIDHIDWDLIRQTDCQEENESEVFWNSLRDRTKVRNSVEIASSILQKMYTVTDATAFHNLALTDTPVELLLRNLMAVTKYNGHLYELIKVRGTLSPLSEFPILCGGETVCTFADYFEAKFDVSIQDKSQPLIKAYEAKNAHTVSLSPSSRVQKTDFQVDEDRHSPKTIVPELCAIAPFTLQRWRTVPALPAVLHLLDSILVADDIRETLLLPDTFPNLTMRKALTPPGDVISYSYDRLEWLGDAFLKYAVSLELVLHSDDDEGTMTLNRSKRISNATLFEVSNRLCIPHFVLDRPFSPTLWFPPSQSAFVIVRLGSKCWESVEKSVRESFLSVKSVADVCESVVGAIALFFSVDTKSTNEKALDVLKRLKLIKVSFASLEMKCSEFIRKSKSVYKIANSSKKSHTIGIDSESNPKGWTFEFCSKVFKGKPTIEFQTETQANRQEFSVTASVAHSGPPFVGHGKAFKKKEAERQAFKSLVDQLQKLDLDVPTDSSSGADKVLEYQFKNPSILEQALRHPSQSNSQLPSYQRLEFLGDALLDWMVSLSLYKRAPSASEDELSMLRSHLLKGRTLCFLFCQFGLVDLIGEWPQSLLEEYQKVSKEIESVDWIFHCTEKEPPKPFSDLMEAVVAAVYIDCGLDLDVIVSVFRPLFARVLPAVSMKAEEMGITDFNCGEMEGVI